MPRQALFLLTMTLAALCLRASAEPLVPMGAQWRFVQTAAGAPAPSGWMNREPKLAARERKERTAKRRYEERGQTC